MENSNSEFMLYAIKNQRKLNSDVKKARKIFSECNFFLIEDFENKIEELDILYPFSIHEMSFSAEIRNRKEQLLKDLELPF